MPDDAMQTLPPTNKQRKLLRFIATYYDLEKQYPTLSEMAVEMGVTRFGIASMLNGMRGRGLIEPVPAGMKGRWRTTMPTDGARHWLDGDGHQSNRGEDG